MLRRTKIVVAAGGALYLLALAVVATALFIGQNETAESPAVHEVVPARNAFGRPGIKLTGQGLTQDLRLLLLPDTISSDRLLARSVDVGHMFDVAVAGDYLMVARASYGIEVYNRHHTPLLAVEAHLDLKGRVVDVEVEGAYLYALLSKPARMVKVSIAEPTKPRVVGSCDLSGKPVAMLLHRDGIYVADYKQGLWALNRTLDIVASPERFHGLDSGWKIARSGKQLYVAALDGRLWRLPLAQGASRPTLIEDFGLRIKGLDADERAVHVQLEGGELRTYNASPRGDLSLVQELPSSVAHAHVTGIYLERQGELLVSLDSTWGARVFRRDGRGLLTLQGSVIQSGNFSSTAVVDEVLYTSSTRGLSSWTLRGLNPRPSEPFRVTSGVVNSFVRWGNRLFGESSTSGLQVYDLEDLTAAPEIYPVGDLDGLAINGDHLWLNPHDRPPQSYHIGSDAVLTPCRTIAGSGKAQRVRSFGEYLVLGGEQGVSIYSTADPCQPLLISHLPTENRVSDVLIAGDYAYASSDNGKEIIAFRWKDLEQPLVEDRYLLPEPLRAFCRPRRLYKSDNYLYVALGRVGLLVLDVTDPAALRQFFYLDTPGFSADLQMHNQLLYVSDDYGGLRILDLYETEKTGVPRVVGSYRAAIDPKGVTFAGGDLLVAGGTKGMLVMPEPALLTPQHATGDEAFVELPEGMVPGRYRLLASSEAGHLSEDRVVTVPGR